MTFTVQVLGASSATPTVSRHPSAQLINVRDKLLLIDCGEGTQMQLRRYRIRYQRINHIFISHLHGDHYLGLAGLIFTLHLFGRKNPLHVYANPVLKEIFNKQLEVSATTLLFPLEFHDLIPGEAALVLDDKLFSVEAFPLLHRVPTHGFVIREKQGGKRIRKDVIASMKIPSDSFNALRAGEDYTDPNGKIYRNSELTKDPLPGRSYAYCSDTGRSDDYLPYIQAVDLLYHEATFMQDKLESAREKQHSTAIDAAETALQAGAKKLLIGHYSARYDELQPLLEEAVRVFPETMLAEEGAVFEI